MSRNYYIILGVPSNATQTDIKAAYRRLAKELHPDHYGEEHAPFQVLQEAYSVLSDPESRKTYDNSLQHDTNKRQYTARTGRYSADTVEPLSPNRHRSSRHYRSEFDHIHDLFTGNFRRQSEPEDRHANTIALEITLSPRQAQNGGNIRLKIPVQVLCPSCLGFKSMRYYPCRRCSGAGLLWREESVLVRYPAGIVENQTMQFSLTPYNAETIYFKALFKIR